MVFGRGEGREEDREWWCLDNRGGELWGGMWEGSGLERDISVGVFWVVRWGLGGF